MQQAGSNQYASVLQSGVGSSADLSQTANANGSDAYQEQVGTNFNSHSRAYISQDGTNSIASQYQYGTGNAARIVQGTGDADHAYQSQTGNNNSQEILQTSGTSFAQQRQVGNTNFARTDQANSLNWSTVNQTGNSNTALVRQR